ncbi:hypothetical protein QL285_082227 [Trifolium repens]|nr:hypothetical protein QL285_082227 [Trifolium repens]
MVRFSHQVPYWLLKGEESNLPDRCFDLDPAATPDELLHTATTEGNAFLLLKKENENHHSTVNPPLPATVEPSTTSSGLKATNCSLQQHYSNTKVITGFFIACSRAPSLGFSNNSSHLLLSTRYVLYFVYLMGIQDYLY